MDVDADENIARREHLRPGERQRQHDGVARRHVGHRNAGGGLLRDRDRSIRQRRAADAGQIDAHDPMLARTQRPGNSHRRVELRSVPLTVVDRERIALEALLARDGQRGGRVEAAGKQHDRRCGTPWSCYFPGTLPHRYLCSWIWKRTGSRSSRIQSASCRAGSCSWLGENSTVQRPARPSSRIFAPLHS